MNHIGDVKGAPRPRQRSANVFWVLAVLAGVRWCLLGLLCISLMTYNVEQSILLIKSLADYLLVERGYLRD